MPRKKMGRPPKRKLQNKKIDFIHSEENLKYLSRCIYYGTLKDYDFITSKDGENSSTVLKIQCYTATSYTGNTSTIRMYVPSDMDIIDYLEIGQNYLYICAPYKVTGGAGYPYRIDLLLNIFKEIDK